MTTPSTERKAGPLLGTGAQTAWPFTFKVFAATDIAVTIADSLGVETALVYGTDYSVALNANQETSPGGTVTYPISGAALPVGKRLVIFGNLPYDQPLDLPSGGNFSPLALENQLDRIVMQIQQLRENVGRALQVSVSTNTDVTLPPPAASQLIGWDATGENLENVPLSELGTAIAYGTYRYDTFTGDGTTTNFTLSEDPAVLANLDVSISGVVQVPGTDYSLVSGNLVFTSAPPNGEAILARYGQALTALPDSDQITFVQAGAGAATRTVQNKLRESVTVQDFGASSSATAAVNKAAFDNALASGAKLVEVINDGGIMLVDGTINVPSGVTLLGRGLPVIKAENNSFPSGGQVFQLSSATGSVIDGLKIDANRQNNGGFMYGVYGSLCVKCTVKNCYVVNTEYGILFAGGNTLKFTGNTVDDCLYYGIAVKLNDVNADCYNIVITGNECKNIASGVPGPAVDGQGIVVYGATGTDPADYKNITEVIINDNICSNCAAHGITLIAVNDFVVDGNNCYDCQGNTDFGSGICLSEAVYNGTVSGNTCTNNYDAGILLDVVDQTGDRFSYGRITVSGNSCLGNYRTGIKINSFPYANITGNLCSDSIWGIFVAKGGFNTISGNTITYCSTNGIRLAGISGAVSPDQSHIIIADNTIAYCVATAGDQYSALFMVYMSAVKVQNNDFSFNTQDLTIDSTCTGVTLLDNRFTSNLYIDSSVSVQRWEDEFRTTAAGKVFLSNDFGGDGITYFRCNAGFTVPHFGLRWVPILSVSPVTSSLTTAIHPGYAGQKLSLINYNTQAITIKHGAATENLGNADVVLAYGELVEYVYTGSVWLQTTAKLATSL